MHLESELEGIIEMEINLQPPLFTPFTQRYCNLNDRVVGKKFTTLIYATLSLENDTPYQLLEILS